MLTESLDTHLHDGMYVDPDALLEWGHAVPGNIDRIFFLFHVDFDEFCSPVLQYWKDNAV